MTVARDFPTYSSEGWLLDEDRAVRDLMKGMTVSDNENSSRRVEAWFGHPDQELREQKYPYVTVDLLQIQEGSERVHRGDLYIKDPPAWWNMEPLGPGMSRYLMEMPHPIDLDYQISTWARNPRHDRQILFQLITSVRLPVRRGLLYTADHKIRRLDYLGHAKRDTVEGGKRLFHNAFHIRVSSEVPWDAISPRTGVFDVTSIKIHLKASADQYGIVLGEVDIVPGTVLSWNPGARTALLNIDGEAGVGVPVSRSVRTLEPDDTVAVLKEAKNSYPANISDYHLLVVGVENPA